MGLDFRRKDKGNYVDLGMLHTKVITKAMLLGEFVQELMYLKKGLALAG